MKSSNRRPRYRRRFLTQARSLQPSLQRLQQAHLEDGYRVDDLSTWNLFFRSLCLKSASEVGATRDGIRGARHRALGVFVTSGVSVSSCNLQPDRD